MKEKYFDENNIKTKSKDILNSLKTYKKRKIDIVNKNTCLLILDMQEYFLNEESHAFIPSAKAIINNINQIKSQFIKHNQLVIFTRHINNDENAQMMKNWWKELITIDNSLSDIDNQILENYEFTLDNVIKKKILILEKSQYDVFYKTNLDIILKINKVEQIIITGVMTHLCCETTARSAFIHGYNVIFPVDATATYNEEFHKASFMNLSHGFVIPVLTEDLLE